MLVLSVTMGRTELFGYRVRSLGGSACPRCASQRAMDGPPDPFSRGLDLPVANMGVAHGHAHIAVAEQAGNDRQRDAVHRRLAGHGMTPMSRAT